LSLTATHRQSAESIIAVLTYRSFNLFEIMEA
jgi:hypothetical protein